MKFGINVYLVNMAFYLMVGDTSTHRARDTYMLIFSILKFISLVFCAWRWDVLIFV
jgi:hypothetical protein